MRYAIVVIGVCLPALLACGGNESGSGGSRAGETRLGETEAKSNEAASDTMTSDESKGGMRQPQFDCFLEVENPIVAGQPVMLSFRLTNRSNETVHILRWYTPLEGIRGKIFHVSRDGEEVPYEGPMIKRGDPGRDAYVEVLSGQTVSATVDLARVFDLTTPGDYAVSFRGRINDYSWQEQSIPRPKGSHTGLTLACSETTVRVVGP